MLHVDAFWQVILSFLLAAIATTAASIVAAILDARLDDPKSFFPLQLLFWMRHNVPLPAHGREDRWRRTLDSLILSLADLQLITGFALLIAGYVTVFKGVTARDIHNAHWTLIVYMSCLSSSTHLAAVLTLRKYFDDHKKIAVLRIYLILAFSALLVVALSTSRSFSVFLLPFHLILVKTGFPWAYSWILPFTYVFYIAIIQLLPKKRDAIRAWLSKKVWPILRKWLGLWLISTLVRKTLGGKIYHTVRACFVASFWYLLFSSPRSIFVLQILFSLIAATFCLAQKFAMPTQVDKDAGYRCSLNNKQENRMEFGQVLSFLLLLQPVLAAWETYMRKLPQIPPFGKLLEWD